MLRAEIKNGGEYLPFFLLAVFSPKIASLIFFPQQGRNRDLEAMVLGEMASRVRGSVFPHQLPFPIASCSLHVLLWGFFLKVGEKLESSA